MRRLLLLLVCLLFAPAAFAACAPDKAVKLGALDWESGQFTTAVLNTLLHEGYGCAQVSTNLVDWRVTPPHVAVERLKVLAAELGIEVIGAELIGLLPLGALQAAADHYAPAEADVDARLHAAVSGLGLSQIRPFHPRAKVIQWALGGSEPL